MCEEWMMPKQKKRITNQTTRNISGFAWKDNDTLLFTRDFDGDENFHIFRVSLNGEDEKDLTPFEDTKTKVINMLNISKDHILIGTNQRDKRTFDVYRLNIRAGDMQLVLKNPGHFTRWVTDRKGKLRVALATDGTNSSVYYRDSEVEEFQQILSFGFTDVFFPIAFTFDNKTLYVASNMDRDKIAFVEFDPNQKRTLSTVFSHPEVDASRLFWSNKRKDPIAASYVTWKREFHLLDTSYQPLFQDLLSKFPKGFRIVSSDVREERLVIATKWGDYLYNTRDKTVEQKITQAPLWVQDLPESEPIQYTSRDGLNIHGYLTLPKGSEGSKNLPLVVKPHGGPWARDVLGYNSEVQFLANRGYAVLQVNFRGSTGYGKEFWMAGFKQWGKKMQDDITDGVQYLIDQGIADKNRIAIYGISYGGYAALAGLTFTPDLYACGVSVVGQSNLFTFLNSIPPYWKPEQLYKMVGHPEKDKQLLQEASPLFYVDNIKAPLFIVHGANDPRVRKAESEQIVKALEARGVEVPYLIKEDEGHGFHNEENRLEFYSLLEGFLEKCLQ